MADKSMLFKYMVKNMCKRNGLTASFTPRQLFQDTGSGMHVHQSVWGKGRSISYDERGYARLSQAARFYVGGLLKHTPATHAFAAPSANGHRWLVPGFEAPVHLVSSQRNRSAAVQVPMYSRSPGVKRMECRCPASLCNRCLTFAALLTTGLEGGPKQDRSEGPIDKNLYDLPPEEEAMVRSTPSSLQESLQALEKDQDFLLKGDVATADVADTRIHYKTEHGVDPVRLRLPSVRVFPVL